MKVAPRSLRGQMLAAFLAVALLPASALGGFVAWSVLRDARRSALEHSGQLATAVAAELGGHLEGHLLYLREVQVSVNVRREIGLTGKLHLAQHTTPNPAIQALLVLDDRGRVAELEPPDVDLQGNDLSRLPYVAEARRQAVPTWSSATLSPRTGRPVVSLVVPGQPWTLVGYLDLPILRDVVDRVRSQRQADVTVIDRDGTILAADDPRYVQERVNVGDVALVQEALAGRSGTDEVVFLGKRQLASVTPVPLTGWVVVASQPVDAAYALVSRIRAYFLAAFALASLLAVAAAILLARRIQRPIEALAEGARAVAGGDYQLALPRGALRETDALAGSFDAMVAAIQERERARAEAYRQERQAAAERERLEEQLRHAQKLEAVGRLAGGVAHDFNNLLTVIVAFGAELCEVLPSGTQERDAAEAIAQAAARASCLTRSLLAYSRKQVLSPRRIDLRDTVREAAQLVGRIIGEDVELAVVLPDAAVPVIADPGQLEQVLMNLCTNARDAMPRGGRLSLTVSERNISDEHARELALRRERRYARVDVRDTGYGMIAEVRARLFEPFFTTKEKGKGTGLGLAIVYGIVRQHEGQVQVRSAPGAGTTVSVFLPMQEAASGVDAAPVKESQSPVPRTVQHETVLLAEDEAPVRYVIRRMLERAGYKVLEAADGAEAVEVFAGHRGVVSLCVFDVVMPRLNGRDAREQVHRIDPHVPVLLLSGYAADVLDSVGPGEDAPELLGKPVDSQDLLAKVHELLARSAVQPEQNRGVALRS